MGLRWGPGRWDQGHPCTQKPRTAQLTDGVALVVPGPTSHSIVRWLSLKGLWHWLHEPPPVTAGQSPTRGLGKTGCWWPRWEERRGEERDLVPGSPELAGVNVRAGRDPGGHVHTLPFIQRNWGSKQLGSGSKSQARWPMASPRTWVSCLSAQGSAVQRLQFPGDTARTLRGSLRPIPPKPGPPTDIRGAAPAEGCHLEEVKRGRPYPPQPRASASEPFPAGAPGLIQLFSLA